MAAGWEARQRPERSTRIVGLADPNNDLPCARYELLLLPEWLGTVVDIPARGDRRRWLTNELATAGHVHFACHARWDPDDPLRSYVDLGHPHRMTLEQLLETECGNVRLVVLSCCSSGVSTESMSDELLGFGTGFLLAAAESVVVSSWDLDDLASCLVMAAFYRGLGDGDEPAVALRTAQHWVRGLSFADLKNMRDEARNDVPNALLPKAMAPEVATVLMRQADDPHGRPLAHPAYWGGFCYHGPAGVWDAR